MYWKWLFSFLACYILVGYLLGGEVTEIVSCCAIYLLGYIQGRINWCQTIIKSDKGD